MIALAPGTSLSEWSTVHPSVDAPRLPHHPDAIPPGVIITDDYNVRFAWTRADLRAIRVLRHAEACEQRGEGRIQVASNSFDGRERDLWFHHIMIVHRSTAEVVATYRVQTAVMAATSWGFFSSTLFELGAMPSQVLENAVEASGVCVAARHQSTEVIRLLWKGLARYLLWNSKRYVVGCCALPGTDPACAADAWRTLQARDTLYERMLVVPRTDALALSDDGRGGGDVDVTTPMMPLPAMLESYLSLGAKVCGAPAFDWRCRTTAVLVVLDVDALEPRVFRSLFG